MAVLRVLGAVFLATALLTVAVEAFARVAWDLSGPLVSAHDLWYAFFPSGFVITRHHLESIDPRLWDPLVVTVLRAPAWVLLGLPGGTLVWAGRRRPDPDDEPFDPDGPFFYDRLAAAARDDETWSPDEDDRAPSHEVDWHPEGEGDAAEDGKGSGQNRT